MKATHVVIGFPFALINDPMDRFDEFLASALYGRNNIRYSREDAAEISVSVVENNTSMTDTELMDFVERKLSETLTAIPIAARPQN